MIVPKKSLPQKLDNGIGCFSVKAKTLEKMAHFKFRSILYFRSFLLYIQGQVDAVIFLIWADFLWEIAVKLFGLLVKTSGAHHVEKNLSTICIFLVRNYFTENHL